MLESRIVRGRIDQGKHDYVAAEKSFRGVIRDPKAESSQTWEAEARLAKVYEDEGFSTRAEKEFRRSLETIEAVRSTVQSEDLRLSFLSSAVSFYSDYIEFLISRHR